MGIDTYVISKSPKRCLQFTIEPKILVNSNKVACVEFYQRLSFYMVLMILNAHTCLSSLKFKLKLISTVEVCRCSSFTTTVTNVFGTKGNGLGLVCRVVNYQNKVISSSSNLLRGGHVHDFHKI